MKFWSALGTGLALASAVNAAPLVAASNSTADKDGKYWIRSSKIQAAFVPYGASLSSLIVNDRYGVPRDVAAGFDNATHYTLDKAHPHFGGVVGRYANRIKNSSFTIDGVQYHVEPNDNPTARSPKGADTLHGGPDGWDWRNFTVVAHTNESITFGIVDPDGKEGFPGEVVSLITYAVSGSNFDFKMVAIATTKKTPIMLSNHGYWNLDGFSNNETSLVLNHTFHLPYGGSRVGVDNILIPTGDLLTNEKGSVNDFWSAPKAIGANLTSPELVDNCGLGCVGYDNCYLTHREGLGPFDWRTEGYVAQLYSPWSGIKLDIYSDQDAFQLYSCNFQDGTMPLKKNQGLFDNAKFPRTIPKYGCVVVEVQDYIDGINQPQWRREKKQIFSPGGDPYVLQASYRFSTQ